ncbi:hypothetical protein BJX99DRAFT_265401 [Aspergillus californicus]
MSSSRLRTAILRSQKPKPRWPDPEKSIGKFHGIKSGKLYCWEAEGPAKEAFAQIRPRIKELLESSCGSVTSSSVIHFDIFMIGETQASALPYVMFSCKHREPRITAVAAMKKSHVLDHCPPGIHVGHWDYPPHLKNLQFLASAAPYKPADVCAIEENEQLSSAYNKDFSSITHHHNLDTGPTLQLVMQNTSKKPACQRTATIGAVVSLCGRRFYLAPAHVLSSQGNSPPVIALEVDSVSEGSDCELESFDYGDGGSSNAQDTEYMSQYSLSSDSTDTEEDVEPYEESSTSDAKSDYLTSGETADELNGDIVTPGSDARADPEDIQSASVVHKFCSDVKMPLLKSDDFDYCLIEVNETNHLPIPSNLPNFSQESIGRLNSGSVDVMAVTASGNLLTGVLSSRLSCIRAPNATRYIDVLSAHFEDSLQPGDSGSIVRDVTSGAIYGHIAAGDIGSKIALVIPAVDVLDDMKARSALVEVSPAGYNQSQNNFSNPLSLRIIGHYRFDGRSEQSKGQFGSADCDPSATPPECLNPALPYCATQTSKSNLNPASIDPSNCSNRLFKNQTDGECPSDEINRAADNARKRLFEDNNFRNSIGQGCSGTEPFKVATRLLPLVTIAFECSVSLYKTINSFRSRQRLVRDLLSELEDLSSVLARLGDRVKSHSDIDLSSLDLPLLRCGNICTEFQQLVLQFASRLNSSPLNSSRADLRGWISLRYMGDDISTFGNVLAGYKTTFNIALTKADLYLSSVPIEQIGVYESFVQDAKDDLECRIEDIDAKIRDQSGYDAAYLHTLREERLSTEKCLQICAQFSSYIHQIRMISDEAGTSRGSIGTEESPHTITNECLQQCKNTLAGTSAKLEKNMQELMDRLLSKSKNAATSDDVQDLLTARDQWEISRQCLEICSVADNHFNKNISVIESDDTGNSLQFMVSTRKELLNAKNGGRVLGYLSNESIRRVSQDLVGILPSHMMGELSIPEDDSTPNSGDVVVGETTTEFKERYGEGFNLRTARTQTSSHSTSN